MPQHQWTLGLKRVGWEDTSHILLTNSCEVAQKKVACSRFWTLKQELTLGNNGGSSCFVRWQHLQFLFVSLSCCVEFSLDLPVCVYLVPCTIAMQGISQLILTLDNCVMSHNWASSIFSPRGVRIHLTCVMWSHTQSKTYHTADFGSFTPKRNFFYFSFIFNEVGLTQVYLYLNFFLPLTLSGHQLNFNNRNFFVEIFFFYLNCASLLTVIQSEQFH